METMLSLVRFGLFVAVYAPVDEVRQESIMLRPFPLSTVIH